MRKSVVLLATASLLASGVGGAGVAPAAGEEPQPPLPTVEIWDTHGVALSGWDAYSDVTITVATDGGPDIVRTVRTNHAGEYWDVLEGGPMQVGWSASATGETAAHGLVTKTLELPGAVAPEMVPQPDLIFDTLVQDTVDGEMTDTAVGRGGEVGIVAVCGDQQDVTRWTTADPSTGAVWLDTDADPGDLGWGYCTEPIEVVSYRMLDGDGDMFQVWWLPEATPQAERADEGLPVVDGGAVDVRGWGFDLGTVRIEQCLLVDDAPGPCDPATRREVLSSPAEGWPYNRAQVEEYGVPLSRFIEAGGRQVDCGFEPCALVLSEPNRDTHPAALVPIGFIADLEVVPAATGTVSTVTGAATLRGTLTASFPTNVHLAVELRQRLGRTLVVTGVGHDWFYADDTTRPWTITVRPDNGVFGGGKAEMTVFARVLDEVPGIDPIVMTVALKGAKAPRR